MRSRVALILTLVSLPALAADQWTRIVTPDFELYTSLGEKHGKDTIRRFEQVRQFFLKASPVRGTVDFPLRIVEFDTEKQFAPFKPNAVAVAFFLATPARDYIVLGDQGSRDYPSAIHEYMHLVVRHSGLKLPLWLNEGWADVYSTLRPMGKETAVGDLLSSRLELLQKTEWMPLDKLTAVDVHSPDYHEESRAGLFYAESWALAHMLYLSPDYKDNFGKFVMALHRGSGTAEAFQSAYGRSEEAVFRDLHAYFDRKHIYGRVFQTGMKEDQTSMTVSVLPAFDARLMLADLLVATGKPAQAKVEYASLEAEQPDSPELAQAMGNLDLINKDFEAARHHFEKAWNAGDADPAMCLQLATLENQAHQSPLKTIAILQRALQSKPGYTDASIQLGLALLEVRDFPSAVSTLMLIPNITPDRAPPVFCGLSYAYIELGDLPTGRENAEKCGKWAKEDADVLRARQLLRLAEGRAQPDAAVHPNEVLHRVTGTARNVECAPEGNRLQVTVGNKLLTFDLPSPSAVEANGTFSFACGPQRPLRVEVEFAPPRSAMETSIGIVRRLSL